MNIAVRIRPLPTYPHTLTATQETRATQDILGPQNPGSVSGDHTAHLLNHPPVILVHAEGGEVLLNRDAVVCQLQLIANEQVRVPDTLVVYTLDAGTLEMSQRSVQFLYSQLQILHYRKKDANQNSLAEVAANTLNTDRTLYTAIARDLFGRTSLARRHYKILFSATNLGDRSIQSLKNAAGIKGRRKKDKTKERDTSPQKITDLTIKSTVDHKNTTIVAKGDAVSPPPPQQASPSGDTHPSRKQSPTLGASFSPREDHQFHLALNEEDA